jgi:hypothetical protein
MYHTAGTKKTKREVHNMAGYMNSVENKAAALARTCRGLRLTFEGMQDYFRSHGYGAYLAQFKTLTDPVKWYGFLYKKNQGGE